MNRWQKNSVEIKRFSFLFKIRKTPRTFQIPYIVSIYLELRNRRKLKVPQGVAQLLLKARTLNVT